MNILVHAFLIHPMHGSEYSVSWNYVKKMSKHHTLYVVVGSTTSYDTLGSYSGLDGIRLPNVHFIFPRLSKRYKVAHFLYKKIFKRLLGDWTRYATFKIWNKDMYRQLKSDKVLMEKIDVIHFLSPVGFHEIGYLYRLGKPCVWGPVGGFTNCEPCFYRHYVGKKARYNAFFKNVYNNLSIATSLHLRSAMRAYDVVIANTTDSERFIQSRFTPRRLLYFPENSMRIAESEIQSADSVEGKYAGGAKPLNCIWCGRLDNGKMTLMVADIVSLMKHKERICVRMVGGGYLKGRMETDIRERHLEAQIVLCGQVPREKVNAFFGEADLHLLTSSYEANTTVMFEAMEHCVPSIVFDHFGMADLVQDGVTGRKIPVGDYQRMCKDFANALDAVIENPAQLKTWALNVRETSKKYTSEKRVQFFERCYKDLLQETSCKS